MYYRHHTFVVLAAATRVWGGLATRPTLQPWYSCVHCSRFVHFAGHTRCSCPSPWVDAAPDAYEPKPTNSETKATESEKKPTESEPKPAESAKNPTDSGERPPIFPAPAIWPHFSGLAGTESAEIRGTTILISGKKPPLSRISARFLRTCKNAPENSLAPGLEHGELARISHRGGHRGTQR